MKKIAIIIICLFLLLSALNFGTSMPIQFNGSTSETGYSIENSVTNKAQEQQIIQNINRLDGYFTENQGQVDNDSVRFYIQGKGVWFLDDGVVFEIKEPINDNVVKHDSFDRSHPDFEPEIPKSRKGVVLRLNFDGCNEVEPKGVGLLHHRSNYFYGNDSSKWCMNVPNYQEVIYENIYDNIDLIYYSNDKGLKYDFIVKPGGEATNIKMNYEGAQELQIDANDNVNILTSLGKVVDSALIIYQNQNNYKNRILGKFILFDSMTYGFEIVGKYDTNKDLVIDPLIYSTFIGGNDDDRGLGIQIDFNGNAYVVGYTFSSNFPNTTGAYNMTHNGGTDVFVLKLNPTGSALLYSTFIGGNSWERGYGIQIDSSGNAYVTGYTFSSNFPNTTGVYDMIHNGNYDAFVLKLNPTGSALLYSTFIGGSDDERGLDIQIDSIGNAYLTGHTESSNFPNTTGAYDMTHNGYYDAFVLKLNPTGSALLYSTFIGGIDADRGYGIQIDSSGNAYVVGHTESSNFPNTTGAYDMTHNGNYDAFVLKLNPTGSALLYSTFIGGSAHDFGNEIQIDSSGNAYVTGSTLSSNFPNTTGAYDMTHNGNWDVFVLKLNPTGSALLYSTFIGGSDEERGTGNQIDSSGNVYVVGYTLSSNFPNTTGAYDMTHNGNFDVFVLKLNQSGSTLLNSTFIGGGNDEICLEIALDTSGNVYVAGRTESSDFPNTTGAYDMTHNGNFDVFAFKLQIQYLPYVLDLKISKPWISRTDLIYLYSNGTDIDDLEQYLTPHFEYQDPNEQVWNNTYFSTPQYLNSRWEVGFTPPKNATLGLYDFRVRFNDTGQAFSNWAYLNDSLLVLNNIPSIEDMTLSNNSALLRDSISIWINATDIEEIEQNLTIELEYRDPSETSWDNTYLGSHTYTNGRWESSFNVPLDAIFGHYDFRVRCIDSDGNYSTWLYLNDSLLIYNTGPKVIDVGLSEISIYRTDSALLCINGTDYETPEDMLSFFIQYKPQSESEWTNLTSNYLNNRYEVSLLTYTDSILGNYDFRVKFEDNESVSSGWKYINDSLEVQNNLPIISVTLDDISVGIQPLLFDLTPYESDIEDSDTDLSWSISPQTYTYIESIEMIDKVNDTLKITPKENVSGSEDIELTLTDKDSGTAVKSDVTIIVDSTISENTPKVTLLSPVNKAVINTLTPTLKWELDYIGAEIITYSVALDESPDPKTTIIAGLTATEYTMAKELVDGKTYYWKVEPSIGICLSGAFSFTINLGFEPIYKVNLTSETESATIKQGATKNINLTVANEGNSVDNFKLEFSSANLQSHISIDKTNVQLDPSINSILKLSIDIPDDFTTGDYTITVTATSLTDLTAKDEVAINVKVVSKDFIPDYDASISISPTSLEVNQGDSENVTITISNDGNIEDDFTVRFESTDFASANIQFSDTSVSIADGDSDTITVTINIPNDIEPGVYTVKFIVESNGDLQESTLTVTVKDKGGGEPGDKKDTEDNTMLYALLVVVVIIIVVLILLFIFLKKKKEKEEEPLVEETPPPDEVPSEVTPDQVPVPVPPPSEQPLTPDVPSEQVPVPETPPEQPQVPEVTPEQPPTPEVTPQAPPPQVEPAPEPVPMPQVEEQPVPQPQAEPQPQEQAPVPKVKEPTIKAPEDNVEE